MPAPASTDPPDRDVPSQDATDGDTTDLDEVPTEGIRHIEPLDLRFVPAPGDTLVDVLVRDPDLATGPLAITLSIAGGRLVILDGKGQLVVALAVPTGYTELSRRAVCRR